jgi:hypothetical protein
LAKVQELLVGLMRSGNEGKSRVGLARMGERRRS